MSQLYTALSVPIEEDLLPLSALLHQRGVPHRIIEERGEQVLMVQDEDNVAEVKALYDAWRAGELRIELSRRTSEVVQWRTPGALWYSLPTTATLIALSIAGFCLWYFLPATADWFGSLLFLPAEELQRGAGLDGIGAQYWRIFTPMFLHFGWLHIVFNALWTWELGRRVEQSIGSFNTLMLCLAIAGISNTAQFLYEGPSVFGGMSGVVYGLLGFSWVAPMLQPRWAIQPTRSVMIFMVGWLFFCMAGLIESMGFGAVANAAHLAGLVSGLALGLIFGMLSRWEASSPS